MISTITRQFENFKCFEKMLEVKTKDVSSLGDIELLVVGDCSGVFHGGRLAIFPYFLSEPVLLIRARAVH